MDNIENMKTVMIYPTWVKTSHIDVQEESVIRKEVIFCELDKRADYTSCHVLYEHNQPLEERFLIYSKWLFNFIKDILKSGLREKVLVQFVNINDHAHKLFLGLAGILKTAHLENPNFLYQVIEVDAHITQDELKSILELESQDNHVREVRYEVDSRYLKTYAVQDDTQTVYIPWKDNGNYLITGGAGGIGMIFAKEISECTHNAKIILTGRSKLTSEKEELIKRLNHDHVSVNYIQVDMTSLKQVDELFADIQKEYKHINGILHCAGIVRDNYIINKSEEEFTSVVGNKVLSTLNIDANIKALNLDFMALFSSESGELGNPGQADYSVANAFLDAFARLKSETDTAHYGKIISINWPLWEEGGMQITEALKIRMLKTRGTVPLKTVNGIKTLYTGLNVSENQMLVMEGDPNKIRALFGLMPHNEEKQQDLSSQQMMETTSISKIVDQALLLDKMMDYIKAIVAGIIKLPKERIDANCDLEQYGIDSVMIMTIMDELEKVFGNLSKTLFFEYKTIWQIAEFFVTSYKEKVIELFSLSNESASHMMQDNSKKVQKQTVSTLVSNKKVDKNLLIHKTITYLKELLSTVIKLPVEKIKENCELETYGIDSVMIMAVTDKLESVLGNLSKTLFFEYPTIEQLAKALVDTHEDKLTQLFYLQGEEEISSPMEVIKKEISVGYTPNISSRRGRRQIHTIEESKKNSKAKEKDIAIIGIAGKYPMADNLDEFWKNLSEAKDCITVIPEDRWDYATYFDVNKNAEGKTYSKWGGFINDIDKFDPYFFNITPYEARKMHPQERLFLECAYAAIEDSGYVRENLGKNVGVYVGAMYNEVAYEKNIDLEKTPFNGVTASIANRVSYFCNFTGPSICINTMCSSSLVTVNLACHAIWDEECDVALAGGVNVSISPSKYIILSQGNFLSSKGRCESFGANGDGYVPGEGVGAIILKPLSKAIADKDHIYGVIKAVGVNHGGKANGYSVPNPNAQAELIEKVIHDSEINPEEISFIEAHGTGTALGDPIEITGLKKVFDKFTDKKQFCRIGAVKSNIGHLESAAGIASITKVLLQMKYGKLVPSLHCDVLNAYIDFENTPFKVQRTLEVWPQVQDNGCIKPRTAGISAFGAGGTNAHIILQEYINKNVIPSINHKPHIIILSAKDESALVMRAEQLQHSIVAGHITEKNLTAVAYTLQVGRESMKYRLGFLASSINEVSDKLEKYINKTNDMTIYTGCIESKGQLDGLNAQEKMRNFMQKEQYEEILKRWINGIDCNWDMFYEDQKPEKISLPTYPFAKVICEEVQSDASKISYEIVHTESDISDVDNSRIMHATINYLKGILSEVSAMPISRIEETTPLEEYGIDSVMIGKMHSKLLENFENLQMTMFFECQSLKEVGEFLIKNYPTVLEKMFKINMQSKVQTNILKQETNVIRENVSTKNTIENMDIAIIGVSGKYPQARDIEEFWENLKAGKDCISEIPKERWDYTKYYDSDRHKEGTIYGKWGGFIEDVDQFDPLFFNLSPEHAEFMDPQERLFLVCAYNTIEDAGYTKESLSKYEDFNLGGSVGVFVGSTFSEYQFFAVENQAKGKMMSVPGIPSGIANRISYYFNLHGPSMTIDTMCSSSLTAIHLACNSLKLGECKMALAGGVNLSLHLNKYLFLSEKQFLSPDGKCHSFSDDANGYVPGEGVGAILLKPLADAINDGDRIYGVIKASAINHGGKTNGYTVPNPVAQTHVIRKALHQANISAREISYVEAHGTGTSLGDPIEIAALTHAFNEYSSDTQYCAIGSVKSNIGHLEAAAGIASVTKVLLQFKHKELVKSIHAEKLNHNIDFTLTPFKVQRENQIWDSVNGDTSPRTACVSAFGAGGSNAHIILQEYIKEQKAPYVSETDENIIILSARNKIQLKNKVKGMLTYINKHSEVQEVEGFTLENIAYTLQIGREHMQVRWGCIVKSLNELKDKLELYLQEGDVASGIYISTINKDNKKISAIFNASKDFEDILVKWMQNRAYDTILQLWINGFNVDWEKLYMTNKPYKIGLPEYPFSNERYWYINHEDIDSNFVVNDNSPEAQNLEKDIQEVNQIIEDKELLYKQLLNLLSIVFGESIKLKPELVDKDELFENYGVDSVKILEVHKKISEHFADLSSTLLLKYETLNEVARYLIEHYLDECCQWVTMYKEGK